jgi:hypothetical protein
MGRIRRRSKGWHGEILGQRRRTLWKNLRACSLFVRELGLCKKKALDTAARPNNLKMSFGFQSIFLLNGGLRLSDPGTLAGIAAIIAALTRLLAELRKWRC